MGGGHHTEVKTVAMTFAGLEGVFKGGTVKTQQRLYLEGETNSLRQRWRADGD